MKRQLILLLFILSFAILIAAESAPSETVGYFRKSVSSGSWGTASLPFFYPSFLLSDILGDQYAADDVVQDVYTGTSANFYEGYGWFGDLEELSYGAAYWVYRAPANPGLDYFLLGKVNPQPVTVYVNASGWSSFSLNIVSPALVFDLVIPDALADDVIQDVYTGTSANFYEGYGWFGDLEYIMPTEGYWYYTTSATPFEWTYPSPSRGINNNPARPSERKFK